MKLLFSILLLTIFVGCKSLDEESRKDDNRRDSLLQTEIQKAEELRKLNEEIQEQKTEVIKNFYDYFVTKIEQSKEGIFSDELHDVVISFENKSKYPLNDAIVKVVVFNYMDEKTDAINYNTGHVLPHSKKRINVGDLKKAKFLKLAIASVKSDALDLDYTAKENNN